MDDINRALGQIEGKLDAFIKQMEIQDDRASKLESRVRSVENKQYWLAGVGTSIGAFITYFIKGHS